MRDRLYGGCDGSPRSDVDRAGTEVPNLLPDGGFERLDADGYPAGWSRPLKYRYFRP